MQNRRCDAQILQQQMTDVLRLREWAAAAVVVMVMATDNTVGHVTPGDGVQKLVVTVD